MKIELEIPDRPDLETKILHIFLGMEHIAVKRPGASWVIKTGKCSMCGTCCTINHTRGLKLPMDPETGVCKFLVDHPKAQDDDAYKGKLICGWGNNRPFNCCIGAPQYEPKCTLTWGFAKEEEA